MIPKVSICIPTYNRGNLVCDAVKSVLRQSFAALEIIVADDGSTDNTCEVVKKIGDNRIRYFYQENNGVSAARNLGLIKAQGQYVAFLDDDDLWPVNYLEVMLHKLEENPEYGVAYSLYKDIYPDGREVEGFGAEYYLSGWLTKTMFKKTPHMILSAMLFRKSVLRDVAFDERLRNYEDVDAFLRLSTKTQFLFVPGVSVIRRKTPGSLGCLAEMMLSFNAPLIWERFYFHFGGNKLFPRLAAKHRIGRIYRGLARKHYQQGHRSAAIQLFKKAIGYYPFDQHYYGGLLKALLLSKKNDKLSGWRMPELLPPSIRVSQNKQEDKVCE